MAISIELNNQPLSLERPLKLVEVLQKQKAPLYRPQGFEELDWINNPRCPLVNIVEVDGQIVSLAVWADRPVEDG
ncbi:MAG: hypothetical protein PVH19_15260, partial [Planctomycetia bacterium]